MPDNSPDLPTPKQAVEVAKGHFQKSQERSLKQVLIDQEADPIGSFPTGEYADEYLKKKDLINQPTKKEHIPPKYLMTPKQCQYAIQRFDRLGEYMEEKMKYEKKNKVTTSDMPSEPDMDDGFLDANFEFEDGTVSIMRAVKNGSFHIIYVVPFTSYDGSEEEFTVEDIYKDNSGIEISRFDPEEDIDEVHFISSTNPNDNEINQNTPAALEKAEQIINAFLKHVPS